MGVLLFVACKSEDEPGISQLSVDKTELDIAENGSTEQLQVSASENCVWTASSDKPWIQVSPASGEGSATCQVKVDNSVEDLFREGTIRFTDNTGAVKAVTVKQSGHKLAIVPDVVDTLISNSESREKRVLKVKVTTNVQFDVQIENGKWLTNKTAPFKLEYGKRPVTVELALPWEVNMETKERTATVKFVPKEVDASKVVVKNLTIKQKASPVITDDRAGDSLALLTIAQRIGLMSNYDSGRRMDYWNGVTVWESTDQGVTEEMVGRVRSLSLRMFNTDETIPFEISKLKYLESLTIGGNENAFRKSITMGTDNIVKLKHLKQLTIMSYGFNNLPDEFAELGKTLESLTISSEHLTDYPTWLTSANFPKLRTLNFYGLRKNEWQKDLRKNDIVGFRKDISGEAKSWFINLMKWEKLDTLRLNVNYLEGTLPTDADMRNNGFRAYMSSDTADTKTRKIPAALVNGRVPRVLPNTHFFAINLNFLTGNVPNWIMWHPHLIDWNAFTFIFSQETGSNTYTKEGKVPGFSNEPQNYSYYYEMYPWRKYVQDDTETTSRSVRRLHRR